MRIALLGFAVSVLVTPGTSTPTVSPLLPYPARAIVDLDPDRRIKEPSGIVFHPTRGTLFVVGDEGDIAELTLQGNLRWQQRLDGYPDLEGITVNPVTGMLYVVIEDEHVIFEFDPDRRAITRQITINPAFGEEDPFLKPNGDGIEGIALVPGATASESPRWFVVNQNDPPVILEVEWPTAPEPSGAQIRHAWSAPNRTLSDISWDLHGHRLAVLSAPWKVLLTYAVERDELRPRAQYAMPGFIPEGITWDAEGNAYVADDSGGIWRLTATGDAP